MIEARTEDKKLFRIFFMKDPDYVMIIMAGWVILYELEGASKISNFIYSN